MAVKTTGAEFKQFYSDPAFWPQDDGNTWHDDEIITVDGVETTSGVDLATLADTAEIRIEGGAVFSKAWSEDDAPSFEGYFKKWRKQQNTATFSVQCDKTILDAVKAAVKAAGGRIA